VSAVTKPTALITGVTGFAGSYLAEDLLDHGFRVAGTVYNHEPTDNIDAIRNRIKLYPLDILDKTWCHRLLQRVKPDYVFHLAAIASVSESFRNETLTFEINFNGTVNLLAAAGGMKKLKKLLFVGSSDSYGLTGAKTLTENQPFNPVSPYGISKAAAEYACRYYYRQHDVPVVVARAFNHSGPRQTDSYVIPSFARQIAAIEAGKQRPVIKVGDLSARRDLSDVRDVVSGYRRVALKGEPGEAYQLCSGRAVAISRVLDMLLAMTDRTITVKVDKKKMRKSDLPVLRGSRRKATQQLGFGIRYKLKDTLKDTLDYWRSRYDSGD